MIISSYSAFVSHTQPPHNALSPKEIGRCRAAFCSQKRCKITNYFSNSQLFRKKSVSKKFHADAISRAGGLTAIRSVQTSQRACGVGDSRVSTPVSGDNAKMLSPRALMSGGNSATDEKSPGLLRFGSSSGLCIGRRPVDYSADGTNSTEPRSIE